MKKNAVEMNKVLLEPNVRQAVSQETLWGENKGVRERGWNMKGG
jgi:hypothetical protein